MKRLNAKSVRLAIIASIMIFGMTSLVIPQSFSAGEESAKEAVRLNVNTSMQDNLTALKGKTVTVNISTGQAITGTVSDVKGNLLHLSKISQKEFYDALVLIDHISAIETRVR